MRREVTFLAKARPCIVPGCRRDATNGPNCNPHYQAIMRRCRQGAYKKEELVACGVLAGPEIDKWLQQALSK